MSSLTAENFAGRVNYAAAAMVRGFGPNGATRSFDNCFENFDGPVVAAALARRAKKNERLRAAMSRILDPGYVAAAVAKYGGVRNLSDAARKLRTEQAGGRRWRIRAADAVDDETGKPLEWSNELGWVEAGFGDEFSVREGLDLPIGGEWVEA